MAGRQDNFDYDMAMGGGLGVSVSPEELLRVLGQAGCHGHGEGRRGVPLRGDAGELSREIFADTFVGEVRIGADNRIARVSYGRATRTNIRGSRYTYHLEVVIDLFDCGMPVRGEAPAAADLVPSK